jgi:tetrahydromethanopterin S-methyltransferase subunit G
MVINQGFRVKTIYKKIDRDICYLHQVIVALIVHIVVVSLSSYQRTFELSF